MRWESLNTESTKQRLERVQFSLTHWAQRNPPPPPPTRGRNFDKVLLRHTQFSALLCAASVTPVVPDDLTESRIAPAPVSQIHRLYHAGLFASDWWWSLQISGVINAPFFCVMGPNHRCIRLRQKFLLKPSPFKWTVDVPGVICLPLCAVWHDGSAGLREESFGTSEFFSLVCDNSWASVHSREHKHERR